MKKRCTFLTAAVFVVALLSAGTPASSQVGPEDTWVPVTGNAAFSPRDSASGVVYNGRMWLSNGYLWPGPVTARDLWSSVDGSLWTLVNAATPYDEYSEIVAYNGKLWAIKGSVWNSVDGVTWTLVAAATPFGTRSYGRVVVYDGRMWQLGAGADVWYSTDGVNWTCATASAPYGDRGAAAVAAFGGRLWVMGGWIQVESPPPGGFYAGIITLNDVWSSADGVNWDGVLVNAPWSPRMWSPALEYRNRLWLVGGFNNESGTNLGDVWYSQDGMNWVQFDPGATFSPRHESTLYVHDNSLWVVAGNAWPLMNDVWRMTLSALPRTEYPLTVTKNGVGAGDVISSPAGIDCGVTCTAGFVPNTVVTLTATPSAGSTFAGWWGEGCSGIGTCQVTMTSARNVTATFGRQEAAYFYTLSPCRAVDTRSGGSVPLQPGETRDFVVTGGDCGVEASAAAVAMNVTAVEASESGWLTVYPAGGIRPESSTINFNGGQVRANQVITGVGVAGSVSVFNGSLGSVDVIIDVSGYFR